MFDENLLLVREAIRLAVHKLGSLRFVLTVAFRRAKGAKGGLGFTLLHAHRVRHDGFFSGRSHRMLRPG